MSEGNTAIEAGEATAARANRQGLRRILKELLRNKAALLGLLILLGITVAAVLAPWISPADPTIQEITSRMKPPGWTTSEGATNWLGADNLGRDILSRLIFGARISLIIGVSAVTLAGTLGTLLGLVAG
ncbi:MAG TPA: ABC transporter permease, partial [Candidatus Methylomirabilis sp.]